MRFITIPQCLMMALIMVNQNSWAQAVPGSSVLPSNAPQAPFELLRSSHSEQTWIQNILNLSVASRPASAESLCDQYQSLFELTMNDPTLVVDQTFIIGPVIQQMAALMAPKLEEFNFVLTKAIYLNSASDLDFLTYVYPEHESLRTKVRDLLLEHKNNLGTDWLLMSGTAIYSQQREPNVSVVDEISYLAVFSLKSSELMVFGNGKCEY